MEGGNNNIKIVHNSITLSGVQGLADLWYKTMVKGVVDLDRNIIALGGQWHMDANNVLIADGSKQKDLWGFNVYPNKRGDEALEYTSLINIRPEQGNTSMEIEDSGLRADVRKIVSKLIPDLKL